MFTVLLAAVGSFGSADFQLLYVTTFLVDCFMWDALAIKFSKDKEE